MADAAARTRAMVKGAIVGGTIGSVIAPVLSVTATGVAVALSALFGFINGSAVEDLLCWFFACYPFLLPRLLGVVHADVAWLPMAGAILGLFIYLRGEFAQ